MTITQAITELLKHDKSIIIPCFGTLSSTSLPAKVNIVTNHFTPPCSKIEFVADDTIQDDTLANYLSENEKISDEEARQLIKDFVSHCKSEFNNYNKVNLEDLGKLARKYDGSYEFELNDTINLNDDAFGLPEFYQNPILRNEVKPMTDGDNDTDNDNDHDNDKQVPVSTTTAPVVDKTEPLPNNTDEKNIEGNDINNIEPEKSDSESKSNPEPEEPEKKHSIWPWILLLLLLLMCAGFVALTYFELIPNYIPQIIKPKNKVQVVIGGEPRAYYHFEYTEPEDTTSFLLPYPEVMMKYNDSIQRIADSIAMETENIATDTTTQAEITPPTDTVPSIDNNTVEKPEPKEEPVVTEPTVEPVQTGPKYLIVCGCFSVEENAQKKVNQLLESGYPNAFYKKRGSMWNAYYDTYSDKQEAKQALDEIRATINAKAWLLETKK